MTPSFSSGDLEVCVEKARAAADRGSYPDVVALVEPLLAARKAPEQDSRYFDLYFLLGVAYCEMGSYELARSSLENAHRLAQSAKGSWFEANCLHELASVH